MVMRRYYLPSDNVLADLNTSMNIEDIGSNPGPIATLLSDLFQGKLSPYIRSQMAPSTKEHINESGVQTITGNTFRELVMDRDHKHTLVEFYTPSCGHCKRFSIMWNQLSRLILSLNWDSVIDVMKMDLSRNDVVHDGVDVRDFPSVYYFPAGSKDEPIQLTVKGDKELGESNLGGVENVTSVLEWMISMDRFDMGELLRLAETKVM